jgi:hypothetical protein
MIKTIAIIIIAILWLTSACFGQTGKAQNNLIPVKPGYDDTVSGSPPVNTDDSGLPKPSDQLYVFWYLGKIISYPIDTAEAYITSYIAKLRQPAQPVAVPASSTPLSNPFDSVKWNAIPPAPPAVSGGR